MRTLARTLAALLALAVITVTLLPLVPSNHWWIRIWDFPRPTILIAGIAALVLVAFAFGRSVRGYLLAGSLVVAVAWQATRILPYTPLGAREMADARDPSGGCLSVLTANLFQGNRDHAAAAAMIAREDADVVFLAEVDDVWAEALEGAAARYPYRVIVPQDNYYGLIFLTRFAPERMEVRRILDPAIPSVRATVRFSDRLIEVFGLHPPPPRPGQSSADRDAELVLAGADLRAIGRPAIVLGDLNDVAWSSTTRLFQRIAGVLDPRLGRGVYPTYHAAYPWWRYPLDQLFASPEFLLGSLTVLPGIGSDHFPVAVRLCLDPTTPRNADPGEVSQADLERARAAVRAGREAVVGR